MKTYLSNMQYWLCFALLVASTWACKKSNPDPQPLTATDIIGEWKISSIQISPAQNNTTDALALAKTLGNDACINQKVISFDPTGRFHIDSDLTCEKAASRSYFSYFSGIDGSEWSIKNNQLVLGGEASTTYQGQTTTGFTEYAHYEVLGRGNQLVLRWQASRDATIDPTQTVYSGDSKVFTYTVTLQNVWRP